jgi:hypothetical protein
MSTPLVAGTAALIREYFIKGYAPGGIQDSSYSFIPSAALVKALLINSGQQIQYITASPSVKIDNQGNKYFIILFSFKI